MNRTYIITSCSLPSGVGVFARLFLLFQMAAASKNTVPTITMTIIMKAAITMPAIDPWDRAVETGNNKFIPKMDQQLLSYYDCFECNKYVRPDAVKILRSDI